MQINSFEEIQRYLQDVNATKEEIEEVCTGCNAALASTIIHGVMLPNKDTKWIS